jgi:hypothetical protein
MINKNFDIKLSIKTIWMAGIRKRATLIFNLRWLAVFGVVLTSISGLKVDIIRDYLS